MLARDSAKIGPSFSEKTSQLRKGPVTRSQAQAEQELLTMLRSLVDNPNTFHVLARKHSECDTAIQPGQNAGDLGWTTRGAWQNGCNNCVLRKSS
eukprot:1570710-Amphidinium_carterae.1